MLAPELNRAHFIFEQIFLLIFFVGVSLHAILRSFRDSGFEQLIYHWPRYGLKVLLIEKPFKADNFPLFAYFELVVLLVCVFYASMVAGVAKVIFHSIGLWLFCLKCVHPVFKLYGGPASLYDLKEVGG